MPEVVNDLDKAQKMSTKSAQEALPACDATGSHSPEAKFPLFKKFPIEIRLKVWGYLEPAPLILKPLAPFIRRHRYIRPVPVLLQICRETRTEYINRADSPKKHITYTFCNDLGGWQQNKKIWVSLEKDSIVIDPFLALQSLLPLVPGSDIYSIRHPIILWEYSSYHSIICFFFLIMWKFKDIKTLTIAWIPKDDPHLCEDTKDGVVDKNSLVIEQEDEYLEVEEYVNEWIQQIADGNPGWSTGEIKIRSLHGLWLEISAKQDEARAEVAKAKRANV